MSERTKVQDLEPAIIELGDDQVDDVLGGLYTVSSGGAGCNSGSGTQTTTSTMNYVKGWCDEGSDSDSCPDV